MTRRTTRIAAPEEILIREPDHGTTHYMRANEYFKAQMYDQAVATYPRYRAIAEEERALYRMPARWLLREGKFDQARQSYRVGRPRPPDTAISARSRSTPRG